MEQDFGAEDLEDGELWLPSDFFSMEEAQTSTDFNSSSDTKPPFCMDDFDLISRSSSFNFLSPHNPALFKPLQTLQFNPAVLYNFTGVHGSCCSRTGTGMIRNQPVYLNPDDAFMGERAWALQLHREHQNRFELNRVRPGGTGVFLPRISETATVGINRMGQGVKYKRGLPPRKRMLNKRPND